MRVSVPKVRRKTVLLTAAIAAAAVTCTVALGAAAPVPVKTGPKNEVGPAAGDDWFAWSQSRQRDTSPFDLYAQHTGDPAFKVNPRNTQAYAGGIDGTTLVYQLIRGPLASRSDLRLYDLTARHGLPVPSGINTSKWECCGTMSGGWLLFSRGEVYSRNTQLVLLRNLTTGEQRVLDTLKNRNGLLSAGQLNGTFAVWARCDPYPRCKVFRYDLSTATATALPVPAGKVAYSPSVDERGTVYYGLSNKGCGKTVQLVRQPVVGGSEVLTSVPQGQDLDVSYAHTLPAKPPGDIVTTRVYYDVVRCKSHRWDIYSVDDTTHVPPP